MTDGDPNRELLEGGGDGANSNKTQKSTSPAALKNRMNSERSNKKTSMRSKGESRNKRLTIFWEKKKLRQGAKKTLQFRFISKSR